MKTKLTWLTDAACPPCRRRARAKQGGVWFRSLCSQSTCFALHILESASSTRKADGTDGHFDAEGRTARKSLFDARTEIVQPRRAALTEEETVTRENDQKQVLEFHVKDLIDMAKMILTKTGFSNAMMVMDKIDGWNEEGGFEGVDRHDGSQVGGRLAACMWIFSKTVILSRSKAHGYFLGSEIILFMKANSWTCAG